MNKLKQIFFWILLVISVLPINYFFENNFNSLPLQVFCSFILMSFFYKFKSDNLVVLIIAFLTLFLLSRGEFSIFFQSPITATFVIIALILLFNSKNRNTIYSYKISVYFVVLVLLLTLYFNYESIKSFGFDLRSKGFGSGTVYSLLVLYSITFLYYLLKKEIISNLWFYVSIIPFILTLFLTQSRGVILTLLIVLLTVSIDRLKKIKWWRIFLIITLLVSSVLYTSISKRFEFSNYENVEQFTSGRSTSQLFIIDEIFQYGNYHEILFGFGINKIKNLLTVQLDEMPHLDILYLLYEGGIILVIIYLIFMFKVYKLFKNKMLFWIFILSSFHTNMVLSPGFLILGKIFDDSINFRIFNKYYFNFNYLKKRVTKLKKNEII